MLIEPPRPTVLTRQRRKLRHRPWATRKPPFWPVRQPGDLVGLDTKQLRPSRGVIRHHFSARDLVSRWDVVEVHAAATAQAAALRSLPPATEAHLPNQEVHTGEKQPAVTL